jgi:hypothetical protein
VVDLLILVVEERGAPDELMPGAWGASARSLPTFLVPDTGAVLPVAGAVGVVWARLSTVQLRQTARRKSVFIVFKSEGDWQTRTTQLAAGGWRPYARRSLLAGYPKQRQGQCIT